MNTVCLIGRLTRAPTTRFEGAGSQMTTATLEVPEPGKDGHTFRLYVPLIAWGKAADALGLLQAEDLVAVQGKLTWRKTTDKHGQEKSTLAVNVREVQALEPSAALTGLP